MNRLRRLRSSFGAGVRTYGWRAWLTYTIIRSAGLLRFARSRLRRHIPLRRCIPFEISVSDPLPRVSVVLPTYNGVGDGLEELLQSLRAQRGCHVHIVAVDSSSTDSTRELLRHYDAETTVIPQREFHHARTRNLGAAKAQGDWILFTVQDAAFSDPRWVADGVAAIQRHQRHRSVSYCSVQIPRPGASLLARYLACNFVYALYPSGLTVVGGRALAATYWRILVLRGLREHEIHIDDTNHLVDRRFFETSGGFSMATCEDMEFGKKVLLAGHSFLYSTITGVRHSHDYRDVARYARRVFVDNGAIGDLTRDGLSIGAAPYLVDSLLLMGSIVLTVFTQVLEVIRQRWESVTFNVLPATPGLIHCDAIHEAVGQRLRSMLAPPSDAALARVQIPDTVAAILAELGINLDVVRAAGHWRRWLRHMEDLAWAAHGHLHNAIWILKERTQTGIESVAEVEHFGTAVLLNTVMFHVSRAARRFRDSESASMTALAKLRWS